VLRWHCWGTSGICSNLSSARKVPGEPTRTTLGAWDLGGLMDQLDEIYPPGGSAV